jgi:CubicO group peptidase (beta-lactamase class C family)
MVTGIACMQLVERGLLNLDVPLGQYVPELKDVPVVVDSDDEAVRTRPARYDTGPPRSVDLWNNSNVAGHRSRRKCC